MEGATAVAAKQEAREEDLPLTAAMRGASRARRRPPAVFRAIGLSLVLIVFTMVLAEATSRHPGQDVGATALFLAAILGGMALILLPLALFPQIQARIALRRGVVRDYVGPVQVVGRPGPKASIVGHLVLARAAITLSDEEYGELWRALRHATTAHVLYVPGITVLLAVWDAAGVLIYRADTYVLRDDDAFARLRPGIARA